MRLIAISLLSLGLTAATAAAQTAAHSAATHTTTASTAGGADAPHNAAIKDPTVAKTGASAAGANSFTEGQARDRIGKAGYANVGALAKTSEGVWAGQATKGKKKVRVALDFKGDVTAK